MTEDDVRKILDPNVFAEDGGLFDLGWYLGWNKGNKTACLDGDFTADELEAIAWWMKNKKSPSHEGQD